MSNYDGRLFQWSWRDCATTNKPPIFSWADKCLLKNYGTVTEDAVINSICCTPDSRYLFLSDSKGSLLMFGIWNQKLLKDFSSKVGEGNEIRQMICSYKVYPSMGQDVQFSVVDDQIQVTLLFLTIFSCQLLRTPRTLIDRAEPISKWQRA